MRILFASCLPLFAGTRFGGNKRLYYLARELERTDDLHLLCLDTSRELGGRDPAPEFRHALYLHGIPDQHPPGTLRLPFDIHRELAARRADIDAFLGSAEFDVLYIAYPQSLCFLDLGLGLATRCRKVVYSEDDLLLEIYRKAAEERTGPLRRLLRSLRYRQAEAFYRRRIGRIDDFVCISSEEEAVVKRRFPSLRTHLLGYGLPLAEYPFLPSPPDLGVLGFIGNYRHAPNRDALVFLLDDLWPHLRARDASLSLVVAGQGIPEALRRAQEGSPRLAFRESVARLEDFYGTIGVFLNPIVSGRGMRTKLVECAAFGRPIVSTGLGAEGTEGLDVRRAEDAEGFLEAVRGLREPDVYSKVTVVNRAVVEMNFSVSNAAEYLRRVFSFG